MERSVVDGRLQETRRSRGLTAEQAMGYLENLGGERTGDREITGDGWVARLSTAKVPVGPSYRLTEVTISWTGGEGGSRADHLPVSAQGVPGAGMRAPDHRRMSRRGYARSIIEYPRRSDGASRLSSGSDRRSSWRRTTIERPRSLDRDSLAGACPDKGCYLRRRR